MSETFRTKVLQQLRESGLDVEVPHEFDFYLYLPTELAAKQAAAKLSEREFATQVRPAAKGDDWLCLASIYIIPETAALNEIGDLFEEIAGELDGEFDGWEAGEAKI